MLAKDWQTQSPPLLDVRCKMTGESATNGQHPASLLKLNIAYYGPESCHSDTRERSKSGRRSRVPEVRVEVFELLLVALHGLEHQLDHLLTVAGAPLVWGAGGKEMENQGNGRVYFHKKTQCYGRGEHTRMPSKPLGFSRSLRNNSMAFPSLGGGQRREGS